MERFERDVYIVYTEKYDLQVAANLWAMLVTRGYNVFYAPRTEAPAAEYEKRMESHMAGSRLHLVLSSSQTRDGVSRLYEKEIELARAAGRLLPVLVDGRRRDGAQPRADLVSYNALFAEDLTLAGVVEQTSKHLGAPLSTSNAASRELLASVTWHHTVEVGDRALCVSEDAEVAIDRTMFAATEDVRQDASVGNIEAAVKRLVIGMDDNRAVHAFVRAPYPVAVAVGAALEAEARNHPLLVHHFSLGDTWSPFVLPTARFPAMDEEPYFDPLERLVDRGQGRGAVFFLGGRWPARENWSDTTEQLRETARALDMRYVFALRPQADWQIQSLRQVRQATTAITAALAEIQSVTDGGGLCIAGSAPAALVLHAALGARKRVVGPLHSAFRDPASRTYIPTDNLRPIRP